MKQGRAPPRRVFHVEEANPRVRVLRFDDGKVNAIGPAFVEGFPRAWAKATDGSKAVVLAGNAKAFSAGLDLKALPTLAPQELVGFARGFLGVFADVLAHPRPVVAAVDGPAIAGGAVLALCSDVRVGTPRARIGLTEAAVGVPFPEAVLELGRARLPPQEHAPALLGGAVREGADAQARGWLHDVAAPDVLAARAVEHADALAQNPVYAFAGAKQMLNAPLLGAFERARKDGAEAWAARFQDPVVWRSVADSFARLTKK